ncbi:MAG: D-alanyl-D-alanine carboxypeptidase family protein [Blastocatellia bacterium]
MKVRHSFALRSAAFVTASLFLFPVAAGRSAPVTHIPVSSVSSADSLAVADAAVSENLRLMQELNWFFGGKAQRGWALYVPLIAQLIGTDREPDSREFAEALARWQQSAGLNAAGVLDQETWMKMVSTFQSQRLRGSGAPPAEQLLQAPGSAFYDPARPAELRYVDREAWAAYQRLLAAAAADRTLNLNDHEYLKIISAYRSPAYQARLRAQSPNSGRAGLAVNSPHFTGRALDLYVGGEPVSTRDENRARQVSTPVYQWLVRNASRFGFHPYFYEPWHWEYRAR